MELSWLGHSCIRVKSKECNLLTDPFDDSLGLSLGRQRADVVTISHPHPHHAHSAGILGNPRVLSGPGEYEIADFYITGIGTDRGTGEGKGTINTIYSMHCEGVTLCHLGDLSRALSPRQEQELGQTAVLFVPAGGVCTLSTSRITEIVNSLAPRIVVPVHFRADGVAADLESIDAFLSDMGVAEPERASDINVTASSLPREPRLVVLQRSARRRQA